MPDPSHMFNRTITVTRPADTITKGARATSWNAHLSGVKCRIHNMSTNEVIRYGGERAEKLWRLSVPAGTDITENDRVAYTDVNANAHTAEVIESRPEETSTIHYVIAREVTP